ncbi:DUF3299 domain-containing protein [Ruegeria arenilitoris]|uniref:DUF3299 domain-containing protein n=1 Tax=Ruegeria arenilitoris TaxID=1173585 RepID=UPI00147C74E1|nr:DUF3299 domain-containing protein [Ruegeria arenilitoris]
MTIRLSGCSISLVVLTALAAHSEPQEISWSDLREERLVECFDFLNDYLSNPGCLLRDLSDRMLSMQIAECIPGNSKLEGELVRIAGYAHPIEFEFKNVKRFLLIPPLSQNCRHPTAPLPDQVIAVEYPEGVDLTADPVWVTGELNFRQTQSELAPSIYWIDASEVISATIPDVTAAE